VAWFLTNFDKSDAMSTNTPDNTFENESDDRDRSLKDELGETIDEENLSYNAEDDSYEYDVKSDDPDYQHADPYDTSAPNGEDMNSTYDEANPYDTKDEYIPNESLATDVDKLGMHIDHGEITELDATDRKLSHTPEDDRDDLDEEGYPKNDRV
jgi:hypothetical protein